MWWHFDSLTISSVKQTRRPPGKPTESSKTSLGLLFSPEGGGWGEQKRHIPGKERNPKFGHRLFEIVSCYLMYKDPTHLEFCNLALSVSPWFICFWDGAYSLFLHGLTSSYLFHILTPEVSFRLEGMSTESRAGSHTRVSSDSNWQSASQFRSRSYLT